MPAQLIALNDGPSILVAALYSMGCGGGVVRALRICRDARGRGGGSVLSEDWDGEKGIMPVRTALRISGRRMKF